MSMSPQLINLGIILGMTQVSKKIPFDDPNVLMGVRGVYILSNIIIACLYFYVRMQIMKKKDLTTLKYVEPAPMGSAEEPKAVVTTVFNYDLQQLSSLYKTQMMGIAMMGVMHIYFKFTNPLIIQSILPLKGAFEGSLVKIHVFGKKATGDLERPWKAAGGFMGMGGGEIKKDKKSIEEAERSGRGGAKEE